MNNQSTAGHLTAFLTALIWGTTFISTKILLVDFQPVEILFFRFVLGLLALLLACPRPLKGTTVRQEATFAAAGLCGICLYYLLENIALTYSRQKSNTQRLTAVLFGAFHLVVLAGRQPSCGLRGKNLSKIPR
jgi:drug/metabolite transporter (DMT)-like permease